jgi:hypothetical protein
MINVLIDMLLTFIKNMTGKYSKQALDLLEQDQSNTKSVRKIVLDAFNDLYREIEKKLLSMKL